MELKKMREMSDAELIAELAKMKKDLFNLRFQHVTGQLENPVLMRETKRDIARVKTIIREKELEKIQAEYWTRVDADAEQLKSLNDQLTEAINAGTIADDKLEDCRMALRSAQWYWDFVFVENSNGVHNKKLTAHCLDQAETFMEQASGLMQ